MNKNDTNMKNKKNLNSSSEPTKKELKKIEELQEMPVEGACSPEFAEGCITIDEENEE